VLPRIYGKDSLINAAPEEWKKFCHTHKIAVTDLIACIEDANKERESHKKMLGGYSDSAIAKGFKKFVNTKVVSILLQNPSITNVYFTRGEGASFWKKLWKPIKEHCEAHNKRHKTLLTPSGYAFYQHGRWNKNNPSDQVAKLEDFILKKWKEQWHL
jgi:hypothetical protein